MNNISLVISVNQYGILKKYGSLSLLLREDDVDFSPLSSCGEGERVCLRYCEGLLYEQMVTLTKKEIIDDGLSCVFTS